MGICVVGPERKLPNFDYNSLRNGVSPYARDRSEWRDAIRAGRAYSVKPARRFAAGAVACRSGAGPPHRQARRMGRGGAGGRRETGDCAVRRWRVSENNVQSRVAILLNESGME